VIFRPRDMQEYYMLFGIFARDTGLYSLSVFYMAWVDFQYTNVYLFCALHTYHCASFTRECHGTGLDSKRLKDVILEYYSYHGFGLKAFEGRHIRINNNNISNKPWKCRNTDYSASQTSKTFKWFCLFRYLHVSNIITSFLYRYIMLWEDEPNI
jgi:hypothetical protein